MMHVMQPVVLDGSGWPTTHAPPSNSPSAPGPGAALLSRSTVNASLSSSAVHDANMLDSQTQNISIASSFKTVNQADVCGGQPLATDTGNVVSAHHLPLTTSANLSKPPKKPLTPYLRYSQKVWPEVRQVNPDGSVCELGKVIGRMWREMADVDKQPYFESFTNAKAEYDKELKTYLDANGLKHSDLVKPKVRKKETKKPPQSHQHQQLIQENQLQHHQVWPVAAAATVPTTQHHQSVRPTEGQQADNLLVYHVRADGTPECYVQRGMNVATADSGQVTEREMLLSTLAEHTRNVTQLRLQLLNARARIVELEQQNELLKQLVRDAQPLQPTR